MNNESRITDIVDFNPPRKLKKGQIAPFIDMAALPTNERDIVEITEKAFTGGAKFRNGDTLFARITPCLENGKTGKVSNLLDGVIGHGSTEFIVMVAKSPEIDEDYVYYLARLPESRKFAQMRMTGTSGRQRVSWQDLAEFTFVFPEPEKRKAAGAFLKIIDDKIRLNNQTLEQIAQAIYKSWFVDYEPTRAKAAVLAAGGSMADAESAAMTAISGKNAAELAAHKQEHPARYQQLADLAAAFPSALVPADDFGEIPVGWEVKPLPEIIDFMEGPGIRNWQYTDAEDGVRFINIRCIQNGDIVLDKANKITKEEAFGKYAHFQLREDDIVVSASGTLGRFAFIRKEHLPLCLNTSVIRFRPIKQKSTIGFIEGFIAGQLQYELETRASGSAQRNFGPMHLKQISIVTPGYELLSLHQDYISSLYCKRKFTLAENDNLVHIRDLLLPQLLKGDV